MIYNEGNEVDIPSVDLLTFLFGRLGYGLPWIQMFTWRPKLTEAISMRVDLQNLDTVPHVKLPLFMQKPMTLRSSSPRRRPVSYHSKSPFGCDSNMVSEHMARPKTLLLFAAMGKRPCPFSSMVLLPLKGSTPLQALTCLLTN